MGSYSPAGRFLVRAIIHMSIATFLKSTRTEMRNVKWPKRSKALMYALVVIIFSLALGYMLGGFDALFRTVLRPIYE